MTLTEFRELASKRIPTPVELVRLARQLGYTITEQDGRGSLRAPKGDRLALAMARFFAREPYRTGVLETLRAEQSPPVSAITTPPGPVVPSKITLPRVPVSETDYPPIPDVDPKAIMLLWYLAPNPRGWVKVFGMPPWIPDYAIGWRIADEPIDTDWRPLSALPRNWGFSIKEGLYHHASNNN